MSKPSIYIVDDNEGFRQSVAFMLGSSKYQIEQFSCAEAVLESLEMLTLQDEVCLLLDVRMPGLSGLDLHDRVNVSNPDLPIIYMTGHADVPLAVEAMKKGAVTLLEKPLDPVLLKGAVEAAIEKAREKQRAKASEKEARNEAEQHKPESSTEQAASSWLEQRLQTLTPRENDVLEKLLKGMANKQCAHELDISVRTVELHRARLLKKLDVRSGAELIRVVLLSRVH